MNNNLKKKLAALLLAGTTVVSASACSNEKEGSVDYTTQMVDFKEITTDCDEMLKTISTSTTTVNTFPSKTLSTTTVSSSLSKPLSTTCEPTKESAKVSEKIVYVPQVETSIVHINEEVFNTTKENVINTVETTTSVADEVFITRSDFALYQEMQDLKCVLSHVNQSLTEMIEENLRVNLSVEDKQRYDILLDKTKNKVCECINAYELGHIDDFRLLANDVCTSSDYMCLDDIMNVYGIMLNSYYNSPVINDTKNYVIEENSVVIDGVRFNNLFSSSNAVDLYDTFTLFYYYNSNHDEHYDKEIMDLINSLQVKSFLIQVIKNARIGFDINTRECFTYSKQKVDYVLNERYKNLSNNYDISSWELLNDERGIPYYVTYNVDGYSNIQEYGTDLYKVLKEYDAFNHFDSLLETVTYVNTNYEEYKNTIENWQANNDIQKSLQ